MPETDEKDPEREKFLNLARVYFADKDDMADRVFLSGAVYDKYREDNRVFEKLMTDITEGKYKKQTVKSKITGEADYYTYTVSGINFRTKDEKKS